MKYSPSDYAKAFIDMSPDNAQFLRVVERNGDFSKIDKIVRAIDVLATKKQGGRMVDIEFARDQDESLAEKFKKKFTAEDKVSISINPSLVAGVRITIDETKEFDNSFRKKVNSLFTNHLIS